MRGLLARALLLSVLGLSAPRALALACQRLVTIPTDSGAGSLRGEILAATAGQQVCVDASLAGKTIRLTTGQITIDKNVSVLALGTGTSVSSGGASRVFYVTNSAVASVSGLTIRDGVAPNGFGGGGVWVDSGATLAMTACTVTSCRSGAGGGGIRNDGTLALTGCTIEGNVATSAYGGGIDNVFGGHLTMTNSTVTGNSAVSNGAGIDNFGVGAQATIQFSTIAYNSAGGAGGGLYSAGGDVNAVSIGQSILYGNSASPSAGGGPDCNGTLLSGDDNMYGSLSGCTRSGTTTNDLTGVDPRLGALQWNGGPTRTIALLPGSPAIDRIASCAINDQRGQSRNADGDGNFSGGCDVGAYEASQPLVVDSLADPGDPGTCTLRQALTAASLNATQGTCSTEGFYGAGNLPDRITFGVTGTIHLTAGELVASESVIVDGPGADKVTVDAGGTSRVFNLLDGTAANLYVLRGLTIANGGGVNDGGGVQLLSAADDTAQVDRCVFRDNTASNEAHVFAAYARAFDVARSTFTKTSAGGAVGLAFVNVDASLTNVTIADTKTFNAAVALDADGSVANAAAHLRVSSTTIAGGEPYGIFVANDHGSAEGTAVATLENSILSGHTLEELHGPALGFVSRGHNVIGDATGPAATNGDLKSTDPLLGVLAYNGGPTPTFNLKPASPARDLVPLSEATPGVDQRGFRRPIGTASDAGAVERVTGGDVNGDGSVTVNDVFYLINYLFAGGAAPLGEADANGDGDVTVNDVFYLINALFAGGAQPI